MSFTATPNTKRTLSAAINIYILSTPFLHSASFLWKSRREGCSIAKPPQWQKRAYISESFLCHSKCRLSSESSQESLQSHGKGHGQFKSTLQEGPLTCPAVSVSAHPFWPSSVENTNFPPCRSLQTQMEVAGWFKTFRRSSTIHEKRVNCIF